MNYYTLLFLSLLMKISAASQKYHYVHKANKTWFEATEYCSNTYGTELATIITKADKNTAISQITAELEGGADANAWVGFTDLKSPDWKLDTGSWYWLDDTPCGCDIDGNTLCDDTNDIWSPSANLADETKHCVEIRTDSGLLTNTACETRQDFLCNAYKYECLFIKQKDNQLKTWNEANDLCVEKYSTELATLSTNALQDEAFSLCTGYQDDCFIGLHDTTTEGTFKWIDGTHFDDYTANWDVNQPDNYGTGEDCVSMSSTSTDKWNDGCCVCASIGNSLCNVGKSIKITSCDGWKHSSYSNSLRVQVHGVRGSTPIFTLNRISILPVDGASMTFNVGVDKFEDTGEPYGIDLMLDDPAGYCIKEVSVHFGVDYKMDFGAEHFGDGVILSSECDRSFIQIKSGIPLLSCLDHPLKLATNVPRGIYDVSMHVCNMKNAGIALNDMSDSLYAVIIGKKANSNAYTSTEIVDLDHYVAGSLNVQYLGVLVAGNVQFTKPYGIAFIADQAKNQGDANAWCSDEFGTELATIRNQATADWTISWCDNTVDCWIGYIDSASGWHWIKDDLSGSGFTNWAPAEPSKTTSDEECVVVRGGAGEWHDVPCSASADRWFCNINEDISGHAYYFSGYKHELYVQEAGVIIGVRIESVNYEEIALTVDLFTDFTVFINDDTSSSKVSDSYVYDDGRYIIFDLDNHLTVAEYWQITVSNFESIDAALNIFFIYKEQTSTAYQLPFIYEGTGSVESDQLNWFAANDACADKYGTVLSSIHSADEQFLVNMYRESDDDRYWIGSNDVKDENVFSWIDESAVDYANWIPGQPDNAGGVEDCVENWNGKWNDLTCSVTLSSYICASPYWPTNAMRTFQFNTEHNIADIIALTVGNNGADSICIDRITVNDVSASYLSANWIGSTTSTRILSSVFKYPVCKSEIMDMRYEMDDAAIESSERTITGMTCANHNRMITSKCSISQTYETTATTSITFSTTEGNSTEYSWGAESSVTSGTDNQTIATTETIDTEMHSFSATLNVPIGTNYPLFALENNNEWNRGTNKNTGTEKSKSSSKTTTNSTSNTITSSYSLENSETYERSVTFAIECSAEIDVPPSHSIDYTLIFGSSEATITTYTDMKLTLCSAFLHPDKPQAPSDYIYIDNIPGYLYSQETQSCSVDFAPAKYLRNDITCSEEQQLAVSTGAMYIPLCTEADKDLYDGCQCEIVDTRTQAVCYCVDETGNIIGALTMVVEGKDADGNDATWQTVCINELQCANSAVEYSHWFDHLNPKPKAKPYSWSFKTVLTVFIIVFSILLFMCYDQYQKRIFLFSSNKRNGYAPVKYMDSDIEQSDIVSV